MSSKSSLNQKSLGRAVPARVEDISAASTPTAIFSPAAGLLSVIGDNAANAIVASRDAGGAILVDGGATPVAGGTPTVANTSLIQMFGLGGHDVLVLDEAAGAMPRANLFGGAGNDALTGGSGADLLFGQADDDTVLGKGGSDLLFGGAGDDVLTGGDADDQMFGEGGDDRMIWNPGDDSDLMEGGSGTDTAEVNGGNGAEVFTATADGARVRFDRLDPAPFALDIGTTERLIVNMNGGDDRFSATGNLAALIGVTVDGGAGDDTILGSNGADTLFGGADNDFIDGQQGGDVAFLGDGDDVFQWDPGDGSDVVEGQAGFDTMLFNGSAGNEVLEVAANGGRARFTRDLGNIFMNVNEVEKIEVRALGGADTISVRNIGATHVDLVAIDLAGTLGGGAGDGQADTVIGDATNGADAIEVVGGGTSFLVLGLPTLVSGANSEGANDSLIINARGGDDSITATTFAAGIVKLTIDAGAGDDTVLGSQGTDVLLGGSGDDFIFGDNGDDVALLGAGDDVFQWNPGDGSDVVEGGPGTDELLFFGAGASENVDIAANGERIRFFRDVANITMDLNDLGRITFRALGGADNIAVGDLTGTDATNISISLAGAAGGGDGAADTVTANGTQTGDVVVVRSVGGGVRVDGLQARISITDAEGASDRMTVNGLGGDDVLDARGLAAGAIQLTLNGGLGADSFRGSAGNDLINGGDGDDVARMGAGDDVFVWNPGDDNDVIEGQSGVDTMLFNGSNASENIDISANGNRALFFRDVANVTMDLNDTETIVFNALGGADDIVVGDLSSTDVTEVRLNLGIAGLGDGQADTITVNATDGDDVIQVISDANGVRVLGLETEVVITGFDANDRLVINGLGGVDIVDASGLAAGLSLTMDGGNGDDVLIGGEGDDILLGGEGDDVLLGGGGLDVIDGGPGDDVEIQGASILVSAEWFVA